MKRNNLKATILGLAIAAATGVAFAQTAAPERSSGNIVDRQTQPPRDAGTSTTTPSDATSGQGAGASQRSSGQFIDRQTKPSMTGSASSGEPTSGTTDVTTGRIVDEQTKPGAGKLDPAQRSGSTTTR